MEVIYLQEALKDVDYWKKSGNKKIQKRITKLIQSIQEHPFKGIGKPEGLRFHHSGKWSRRITQEDRLIYSVEDGKIYIFPLRGHYKN